MLRPIGLALQLAQRCSVLFANKSLIGIHASSAGRKIIVLPQAAKVVSLWDGVALGRVTRIEREMRTARLYLGWRAEGPGLPWAVVVAGV